MEKWGNRRATTPPGGGKTPGGIGTGVDGLVEIKKKIFPLLGSAQVRRFSDLATIALFLLFY